MKDTTLKPASVVTENGNYPYNMLARTETIGSDGLFGFQISVAGSILPDLDHKDIRHAMYEIMDKLRNAVMARVYAEDPKTAEQAAEYRSKILGCFKEAIYIEEIPNGYHTNSSTGVTPYYALHMPWFIVTTPIGRFKIGDRKRVTHIDWEGVKGGPDADVLFKDEDTTKWRNGIHAWTYEKAAEYIAAVIEFVRSGKGEKTEED